MLRDTIKNVDQGFSFGCGCCLFVVLAIVLINVATFALPFLFVGGVVSGIVSNAPNEKGTTPPAPTSGQVQQQQTYPAPPANMQELRALNKAQKAAASIVEGLPQEEVIRIMGSEGTSKGRIKSNAASIETIAWQVGPDTIEVTFTDGSVSATRWK